MAKELDKVITVGDEDYKVNAVTADKVNKKLKINKIDLDGNVAADSVEFDGEYEKSISIVPVEGGRFAGPVRVENNTEAQINDKAVLNYHDIVETVFGEFKNHSALYIWNSDDENKFKTVIEGTTPNSISLVSGLEEHLSSFANENYYNGYLSVYLYLCTDTGNIYYGAANKTAQFNYEPIRLAKLADEAKCAKEAETADCAKQLTSTVDTAAYDTAAKLATAFSNIDTKIKDIDGEDGKIAKLTQIIDAIKGTDLADDTVLKAFEALNLIGDINGSKFSYDVKTIKELLDWKADIISGKASVNKAQNILDSSNKSKTYQDILTAIKDEVTKVTKSDGGYTAYKAGRLTTADGTITAAELLDTAQKYVNKLKNDLTKSKDSNPLTVTKAQRDEDGWRINHGYYRCKFNIDDTNTITISTSAPSGGVKGDIWIKYVK